MMDKRSVPIRTTVAVLAVAVGFLVLALAAVGARTIWRHFRPVVSTDGKATPTPSPVRTSFHSPCPISKLPGPSRAYGPPAFRLSDEDSAAMIGMDDRENERWCDMAGNFYASTLTSRFSYTHPGEGGPSVRVRVDPESTTLRGRLEAHRLKPNFAYQIKLRGLFEDRRAFEAIGYVGRWRLPGRGTNYTDYDYRSYASKGEIESYVLFDFFITDANGDAVRDFALDSSLHVLWNAARQGGEPMTDDLVPALVDAGNPDHYLWPKSKPTLELIWAEREATRYHGADQVIQLPPGPYKAELILTEESFHSPYPDGGYWATVYRLPIDFMITPTSDGAKAN